MMAYKRLSLTDITIPIGRGAKACANDFDRFKGMVASKTLRKKVRASLK